MNFTVLGMKERKNDHTENLGSAILASGDSCGIGAFIPEGSQTGVSAKEAADSRCDFVNWIFIIVCAFGDGWNSDNAAIRLAWLFQNGDFVCSSADLRGRSRLWILDIPGEEDTENEPVRCLKGNRSFLMASKGSI